MDGQSYSGRMLLGYGCVSDQNLMDVRSGVATGWHGWTMSRGPGAKGAPKERHKQKRKKENEEKEIKEKEEKKRDNETFQIPGRGPHPIYPHESKQITIITQSLKYETNSGEYCLMYSFSACMSSKISHLKFGAYKFESVQWSRTEPFKNNSWSRTPNFPIRSSGVPINFSIARVSNLRIASSKGPQMFHCAIKGPPFPHHGIKMMTSNFPSRYQEVPIYHCAIKGPPL